MDSTLKDVEAKRLCTIVGEHGHIDLLADEHSICFMKFGSAQHPYFNTLTLSHEAALIFADEIVHLVRGSDGR